MNTPDNKGAREYWIHEWTDSQPEGFLSGEVRHTIEFDVSLHPRAGFTRVIDYRALTSALERIESLEKKIVKYDIALSFALDRSRHVAQILENISNGNGLHSAFVADKYNAITDDGVARKLADERKADV